MFKQEFTIFNVNVKTDFYLKLCQVIKVTHPIQQILC